MSNHNFVLLGKRNITAYRLEEVVQKVLQRRFPNLFELVRKGDYFDLRLGDDTVFTMFLKTSRTIDSYGARLWWETWIETVVRNEIACELGGRLGSECCEDRWDPQFDKWHSLAAWFSDCSELPVGIYGQIIKDTLPAALYGTGRVKAAYVFTDGMADFMRRLAHGVAPKIEQVFEDAADKAAYSMLCGADFVTTDPDGTVRATARGRTVIRLFQNAD